MRAERGITIRQLSERTGLSVATICYVEKGLRDPHIRTLHRFAEGLGVTLDELEEDGQVQ